MVDYKIIFFADNNVTLAFDGRRISFPLPIVDGKYPEGPALESLLSTYVRNARTALPSPVVTNASSIQRMVVKPDNFEAKRIVRFLRNRLLNATEWTQTQDNPLSPTIRLSWQSYRQSLRELPRQPGFPFNVVWPVPPTQIMSVSGIELTDLRGTPTQSISSLMNRPQFSASR